MYDEEHVYHFRRAQAELDRAREARLPAAVRAHVDLAAMHLRRSVRDALGGSDLADKVAIAIGE
ncbi:hypothetical protein HMF7854_03565 [Sphingomonas ginkgonis]|uniref:Uncharacterized protein n=1 Tax=Sphingomonas ginkgonis TaxID=2315330 RepID=A0A3R9YL58_9SPHN|nr:hypothetical protein [Sphingomonas ginkgonis]RST30009.1 hypothetical protein HMF7854_03565 [Sphingomonas ginkgonis]